jgi:hypothetical protein
VARSMTLSPGRSLAFKDQPYVVTLDYQSLIPKCDEHCFGHESDCYEEEYVTVVQSTRFSLPLSKLETVFDPDTHVGRPFNDKFDVREV